MKSNLKKPCPYIFIYIYLVYTHNIYIYKTQVLKTMISKTVKLETFSVYVKMLLLIKLFRYSVMYNGTVFATF